MTKTDTTRKAAPGIWRNTEKAFQRCAMDKRLLSSSSQQDLFKIDLPEKAERCAKVFRKSFINTHWVARTVYRCQLWMIPEGSIDRNGSGRRKSIYRESDICERKRIFRQKRTAVLIFRIAPGAAVAYRCDRPAPCWRGEFIKSRKSIWAQKTMASTRYWLNVNSRKAIAWKDDVSWRFIIIARTCAYLDPSLRCGDDVLRCSKFAADFAQRCCYRWRRDARKNYPAWPRNQKRAVGRIIEQIFYIETKGGDIHMLAYSKPIFPHRMYSSVCRH